MDALGAQTMCTEAYGQAVWFWLPDAGVNPRVEKPGGMVAKKPGTPGRARSSRKTIAQGVPSDFGVPVLACVRLFRFARVAVGAACTRHSLRPCVPKIWQNVRTGG
jgi:hypothetical protein